METGRVEGVQHMAGTPLRCAVVGKFGYGANMCFDEFLCVTVEIWELL